MILAAGSGKNTETREDTGLWDSGEYQSDVTRSAGFSGTGVFPKKDALWIIFAITPVAAIRPIFGTARTGKTFREQQCESPIAHGGTPTMRRTPASLAGIDTAGLASGRARRP